ncbi:MAG: glycoside hydrolase family 2 TIM barrel-domain containing protein [Ignavibacteriaceae bacterium]
MLPVTVIGNIKTLIIMKPHFTFWLSLLFFIIMNKSFLYAGDFLEKSLNTDWTVFSSESITGDGSKISAAGFSAEKSYKTDIPKTILAALVENGVYKDPYFGGNILKIPEEQFQKSWWYRKEFTVDETAPAINYWLTLEGVNYKADLWINGKKAAGSDKIEGAFGRFDFNVTSYLVKGNNIIAVEVFPPQLGDLTIGFVDWNPAPPDKNMGLWRGIKLKKTGAVSIDDIFVKTKITKESLDEAELTISGVLKNTLNEAVNAEIKGSFDKNREFAKTFLLQPKGETEFSISPDDAANLKITDPHLWWPNNLGDPYLYDVEMKVYINNQISDEQNVRFGIREVDDFINENGHRGYKVNGKKIVIKGAGWVDDMMLNDTDEKVIAQIEYAKHMNLNTIRLEGFWGKNKTLYNAADENGILLMVGWSCQWEWKGYCGREETKYMCIDTPKDVEIQTSAYNDQVKWLRNHPSIFVWVYGSDKYPSPEVQSSLNSYLAKSDPTRPTLLSCSDIKVPESENTGNMYEDSRVKMYGPYDYEPPVYWYADTAHGGAYGFNTETGPGPQVPPLESLKKMLPEENLWPIDSMWDFHCGRNEFNSLNVFLNSFNKRYGEASSLEEFAAKCQISNYEAMRPMFESFSINKFNSTGVIQWMYNSAWPEMYWQLFDHYLMPNGAFYGAKKGCQPLNLVYNYKDKNIYIVNDYYKNFNSLKANVKILSSASKLVYEDEKEISVNENSSKKVIDLPGFNDDSKVFFINLVLKDASNNLISDNFYWISSKEDIMGFDSSKWFYTPIESFADYSDINNLPAAKITYDEKYSSSSGKQNVEVILENNSDKIAFFIELKVVDEQTGQSFLPIFWDDNYVSLLPGTRKKIKGTFSSSEKEKPKLIISGWNID